MSDFPVVTEQKVTVPAATPAADGLMSAADKAKLDGLSEGVPGPAGPQGETGPQGPQGIQGPGNQFFEFTVEPPDNAIGNDGDAALYFTTPCKLYRKDAGVWEFDRTLPF